CSSGIVNVPCASVVVLRDWFVAVQTAVTVAPGSTPPVPSVIEPLMSPVVRCANAGSGKAERAASVRQATQRPCGMKGAPWSSRVGQPRGEWQRLYAVRARMSIEHATERRTDGPIGRGGQDRSGPPCTAHLPIGLTRRASVAPTAVDRTAADLVSSPGDVRQLLGRGRR